MAWPPGHLLIHAACAATLAATVALPARAAPPASAYAALPVGDHARLAPDGSAIVMIGNDAGKPAFVVLHLDATPPKVFSAGQWTPESVTWKTSAVFLGNLLITYRNWNSDQIYPQSRLLVVAADGSKVTSVDLSFAGNFGTYIPLNGVRIAAILPDDPDHILMHTVDVGGASISRIDVRDGSRTNVQSGRSDVYIWYTDAAGRVRAGKQVKPPSSFHRRVEINILARAGADDPFRQITTDIPDGKLGYEVVGFSPSDPDQIYLLTNGPDLYHVIRAWRISAGQPGAIIGQSPGRDVEPILHDGLLIGYDDEKTDGVPSYFDPAWQHDADLIHHALGQGGVKLIDRTADGKRALASVQQNSMPLEYWLLDRSSGKTLLRTVINTYDKIAPNQVAPAQWVSYRARDGLNIPALLTLPPGQGAGNLPFVVLPHGGPSAHDSLRFDWLAQFIASRGYGVLQPQFRGSTGFGSALHDAGLRQWGLAMQDDVTDGTRYLAAAHLADPKRICIVGASYGGYVALEGVVKEPNLYRCAAAFAPVTNLLRLVGGRGAFAESDLNLPLPDSDSATLQQVSPVNGADRIRVPVLLVHGKQDFTVQVEQSHEMEFALKQAGRDVHAVYLDDADHYLSTSASRLAFLQALEPFLAANLLR